MNRSASRAAAPCWAQASFAKMDDYLAELAALDVGAGKGVFAVPGERVDAAVLGQLAQALVRAEEQWSAAPANVGMPAWRLPLFALGAEPGVAHPLTWLNLSERKQSRDVRACHEWYLCLEDDGLWLTFEHGQFGYRRERQASWSKSFARLSDLLAGVCTWHQFGDLESRRTLLGKGQFYWRDPANGRRVPVDNFVFELANGCQFTIAGMSHRAVLSAQMPNAFDGFEWYDDYAQALLRLADLLEGAVAPEQVGQLGSPDSYAAVAAQRTSTSQWTAALSPQGRFIVKCIYAQNDVHAAPVLVYLTKEGRQAVLATNATTWTVRLNNPRRQWRERQFELTRAPDALRTLAQVLTGTLAWRDL